MGGSIAAWWAASSAAEIATTVAAAASATATVAGALDKPDVPSPTKPMAMPDPLEQEAARRKSLQEQFARRGRAASVLTNPTDASGKLGG